MDELTEWWSRLSPFLIPIAAAVVALLIRDLLEPHQWQRYVRKVTASAFFGILVFAVIALGYILLVQRISEDSLLAQAAALITALSMILAPILAAVLAYHRVDPDLDWYTSSRFNHSFQNGSWPVLSMDVRSECLPEGATYINGCIAAVRENVGEYHLKVAVGIGSDVRTVLDGTTRNPRHGWMRVMRAVLNAQLGDMQENLKWQDRIHIGRRLREWQDRIHSNSKLREWLEILTRTPAPTRTAQYKWQNDAYMQIHRLALRMDARGVSR